MFFFFFFFFLFSEYSKVCTELWVQMQPLGVSVLSPHISAVFKHLNLILNPEPLTQQCSRPWSGGNINNKVHHRTAQLKAFSHCHATLTSVVVSLSDL